jgi:hypothetical protein
MKLILVFAGSMMATFALVFFLVLPGIYGIDPSGIGGKLGLNGVSSQKSVDTGNDIAVQTQDSQNSSDQTYKGAGAQGQSEELPGEHQETFALTVPPKQILLFKFAMARDYELDYRWATDGKPLYAELRGKKETVRDDEFKVFGKLKESKAKGFFIAPFSGNYSLYWDNKSDQAVKVRLTAKGVYKVLN